MSNFLNIALAVFFTASATSAFAEEIQCVRVSNSKGPHSLQIKITSDTILTLEDNRMHHWRREDAGLFSYWGTDVSKINQSNEKFIDHLRLDLGYRKTLKDIPGKDSFRMEVEFIWESTYFDTSGVISKNDYICKRI